LDLSLTCPVFHPVPFSTRRKGPGAPAIVQLVEQVVSDDSRDSEGQLRQQQPVIETLLLSNEVLAVRVGKGSGCEDVGESDRHSDRCHEHGHLPASRRMILCMRPTTGKLPGPDNGPPFSGRAGAANSLE
jgi:hypothetical protein